MKLKSFRRLSNVIICSVLVCMLVYLGASSYSYVFSYQNSDVIYNGNRDKNQISIMFNVYWGTEYIESILDTLDMYNVKSTFFVGGKWVEKESEMLAEIISHGHEIGNHGYFHKDQEYLSYDQNYDEIKANHQLVKAIANMDMALFAPPSGSFNKSTIKAAKDLGYQVIMWSKDTIDWRDKDANIIFDRATKNITNGDLILAHPTEMTMKALPLILEYYKINGLIATTVSECLK
jgi:peptidoglycan/xylan/chitin deacetylase (PgdA/CDA1 family)